MVVVLGVLAGRVIVRIFLSVIQQIQYIIAVTLRY